MTDRFIEDKQNVFETEKGKFDLKTLLSGGFIKQRQKELFTIRCRVPAGRLDAKKMKKIAEVAEKYSKGFVHLSFRQSAEIPYVNIKDFAAVTKELSEVGQTIASCGPRVRAMTACGGCEYNPNGLTDTQGLAIEMDKKFFGTDTPHKFKISFSGCPIDCARTREMDLGFQGVVEPVWDEALCDGCTLCAKACKEGAIVSDEDGKPIFDPEKCIYCGDCIRVCPTESWKAKRYGHMVRVGGKHGRHPREADVVRIFISDDEVSSVIEKVVDWYQKNGKKKERIGLTIERLGLEKFKEEVFGEKEVEVESGR